MPSTRSLADLDDTDLAEAAQLLTRRLRINAFGGRRRGPIWECDEHAATLAAGAQCPGPKLDELLAAALSVRAAYAFGDWPPASAER